MATAGKDDLQLSIGAKLDGLTVGLTQATQAVNQAAQQMRGSLASMSDGARSASAGHEKHIGSLRDLKGEMTGSIRTANFFARSMNDIFPATSLAGEGVRLLISGLAFGGGLGLAIEGVMAGVKLFGEHLKEARKESEEAAKQALEDAKMWREVENSYRSAMAGIGAPKQSWIEQQVEKATEGASKQIEKQTEKLAEANDKVNAALKRYAETKSSSDEEAITAALAQKQAEQDKLEQLEALRSKQAVAAHERATQAADRKSADDNAITFYQEERKQIEANREARKKAADEATKQLGDFLTAYRKALEAQAESRAMMPAGGGLAGTGDGFIRYGLYGPGENPGPGSDTKLDKLLDDTNKRENQAVMKQWKWEMKDDGKAEADARKEAEKIGRAFSGPLESALNSTFRKLLQGQVNFAQMMRDLWMGVAESLVNVLTHMFGEWLTLQITTAIAGKAVESAKAVSEITANAGIAGSAAAASYAAIPFVGPAVAVGVGEAMAASVIGAFMPYAAAARGYDVPAGMSPITQLHPKEMVLPANIADPLRTMLSGRQPGAAAGSAPIQIVAFDGRDVLRTFKRNETARLEAERWSRRTRKS